MQQLGQLENIARRLDPDAARREQLTQHVIAYANDFLDGIPDAPAHSTRPNNGRGLYDSPIAEQGIGIDQALRLLKENVDSIGINATSGRYLGYIPGGGLYHAALGDYLAAVGNQYAGLFFAGPGAGRIENMLVRWMADTVGYPDTAAGNLTSGGSLANLTAIVTARDAHGIAPEKISRSVVYVTHHAHHCIHKALHLARLRSCIRRVVPVDERYRMDPVALNQAILADQKAGLQPWLIVATAGTTNTTPSTASGKALKLG